MAKNTPGKVVPTTKPNKEVLTPLQKKFRAALRKIEKIKKQMEEHDSAVQLLCALHQAEVASIEQEINDLRRDFIRQLDVWAPKLTVRYRGWASALIAELSFDLIEIFPDIESIHDKHSPFSYQQLYQKRLEEELDVFQDFFKTMTGIDISEDASKVNIQSQADMNEFVEKTFKHAQTFIEEREAQKMLAQKRKTSKKSEEKQKLEQEKARLKQEQEKIMNKNLRALYLELVKEHHPDLEQDAEAKAFKTNLMQQITKAYESADLAKLMELQIQYMEKEESAFLHLPSERLELYVKLLQEQVKDMQDELDILALKPLPLPQYASPILSPVAFTKPLVHVIINQRIRDLSDSKKIMNKEMEIIRGKDEMAVKTLIKKLKEEYLT